MIDMYAPYMTLIKEIFPQSKIMIDKFHLVHTLSGTEQNSNLIHEDVQKTQSQIQTLLALIFKDPHLNRSVYCFKQPIRKIDILNSLLDLSPN